MKLFGTVVLVLVVINITNAEQYVFKFGVDHGRIIHTAHGRIPLLTYKTEIPVPIPNDVMVTYVEVTVNSLSSPKVDYDASFKTVNIVFSWTQIPASTYKIVVKGN